MPPLCHWVYTSLEYKDIKEALLFTIKLAFRNNRSKYISVYEKSVSWVNSFKDTTFAFDETKLIKCVDFLEVGNILYKQCIGEPIGINPGPYMANLTMWYFENKFLDRTY